MYNHENTIQILFKVGLTDQLDDHFDIIPLQTGPSKGKIVDSSVEDN